VWGTLALGVFYDNDVATNIAALATGLSPMAQFLVQLKGVVYVGAFTCALSFAVWYAIKLTLGVRVSPDEEFEGLDVGEHGMSAYPDFATHPASFGGLATSAGSALPRAAATAQPVTAKP
jgi:Amt family ammonium transporter